MVQGQTETVNGTAATLRFRLRKTGMLRFISHLDFLRTMEHAVVRAGLPVRYSEGFNPHVKLSFGMPLSVGAESVAEYMDVQLLRPMDTAQAMACMNAQLPDGLQILTAAPPVHRFSEISCAEYLLRLSYPGANAADAARIQTLWSSPLTVLKRTKKGEMQVDISPLIRKVHLVARQEALEATVLLSAASDSYLNPEYLLRAATQALSIPMEDPTQTDIYVLRRAVFLADGVTPFS